MAGFDYDVVVIGSGFGGSVAAFRAAEKGYRVGVMESGKRWNDEYIPKTNWNLTHFLWQPEIEMYGIQRMEYLDDVLVLSGAGVGGGSHVHGNVVRPAEAVLRRRSDHRHGSSGSYSAASTSYLSAAAR
jgi:cholesterol oxidase